MVVAWFWFVAVLEVPGRIAFVPELFTRLWAATVTIELTIVVLGVDLGGHYQYPLLLGALTLCGGGRWSLDRLISREL